MKVGQQTRSEIVGRLGEPDAYVDDIRVAAYLVNSITRRNVTLLLGIIPLGTTTKRNYEFDIALIQFDEGDHVRRFGMRTGYGHGKIVWPTSRSPVPGLEYEARKWLAEKEKEQRSH